MINYFDKLKKMDGDLFSLRLGQGVSTLILVTTTYMFFMGVDFESVFPYHLMDWLIWFLVSTWMWDKAVNDYKERKQVIKP